MEKQYYVYILSNRHDTVIYTGMTNDLLRRVHEHKTGQVDGFTKQYNIHKLVYYEATESVLSAITREKQIKKWSRERKDGLITGFNPTWRDLYDEISD